MATEIQKLLTLYGVLRSFWGVKLLTAEVDTKFDEQDKQLVRFWDTGPCCTSGVAYERQFETNIPEDSLLLKLEMQFTIAVNRDEIYKATKIFCEIMVTMEKLNVPEI
jgi:hypothetical protein